MVKQFDPTKPVRTRDGRPARIICTNRKHSEPIVALLQDTDGREFPNTFTKDGLEYEGMEHSDDLVNIPEKVTCHVYRGRRSNHVWLSTTHYFPDALVDSEWVKQVEIEV